MKLVDAIKQRRSIRRFDLKKPDWRKIIQAIDAVRFAPCAGNQFVTKFILVSNGKKIKELAAASQQDFVGTAKYIVVAVSDDSNLIRDYGKRGKRFCAQQAGAAIENFLLALVDQKLVTTWVGHFYEEQVRRTLGIPEGLHIEALFPIGIETKIKTREKRKKSLDHILYFDKWKNYKMEPMIKVSKDSI